MTKSSTYTVTFRARPGVDGVRALRAVLKFALRRFGLQAIDARENRALPDSSGETLPAQPGDQGESR
jgi:hypothetical protein